MNKGIQKINNELVRYLPNVRGKYRRNFLLSDITWFRVGGMADILFIPKDEMDLQHFLKHLPQQIPIHILGAGSNVLIRDGGIRGVVVKLGKGFSRIKIWEGGHIEAGASVLDVRLAYEVAKSSLTGLEFFRGIPGTIGAALAMNAGAYGGKTESVLLRAVAYDRKGARHELKTSDFRFSYRNNQLPDDFIFTSARFFCEKGSQEKIKERMDAIQRKRESHQPIKARTGGSTFKNPFGLETNKPKAWQLIDKANCRGRRLGGAEMSSKHCNFLINHGAASASDLEDLAETVRSCVKEKSGISLEWEIKRMGESHKLQDG